MADPGFSVGGAEPLGGGHQLLTWVVFGENVCINERIGSRWGGTRRRRPPLDPPMMNTSKASVTLISLIL